MVVEINHGGHGEHGGGEEVLNQVSMCGRQEKIFVLD
jgi:hypothetical protein